MEIERDRWMDREREREREWESFVQFVSSENARIIRFPMFEREKLRFEKMEFPSNELGNLPFFFPSVFVYLERLIVVR